MENFQHKIPKVPNIKVNMTFMKKKWIYNNWKFIIDTYFILFDNLIKYNNNYKEYKNNIFILKDYIELLYSKSDKIVGNNYWDIPQTNPESDESDNSPSIPYIKNNFYKKLYTQYVQIQ